MPPTLLYIALAAFASLTLGTLIRLWLLRGKAAEDVRQNVDSLRSWWIVAVIVATAAFLGPIGVCALMMVVSWLAFGEFLRLAKARPSDRLASRLVYALIPLNYGLVFLDRVDPWIMLWPGGLLLLLGVTRMSSGPPSGFLRSTATLSWGALLTIFTLSYVPWVFSDSVDIQPAIGATGLFLFLILLTEINDIAQALVGRRLGRTKVAPVWSPKKTWEGLLGGVLATTITSIGLAPWLLSPRLSLLSRATVGVCLSVMGFLGDLHMSALKRDAGVKDSGHLLPGQGGILDRIDSLTFTAPTFFYLAKWFTEA